LDSEYVIQGSKPWDAKVFLDGKQIAEIKKEENLNLKLVNSNDGHEWIVTKKVHGEFRPFSISILDQNKGDKVVGRQEVFTIRASLQAQRHFLYAYKSS
jgi:hypothetical protein